MTELERYFAVGRSVGCPADQMQNFERAGIILQERQLAASAAARLCDHPNGPTAVGYGGARGGGKSHWLLAQMGADDCQRVPGLKCLLLRKVGKANMEHFEDLRKKLFGALDHEFSAYRGILTFKNGSRIIAGHFQNEKDIDAYLGLEYDVIGIEEATTLTARKYQDITTCCRSSKPMPPARSTSAYPDAPTVHPLLGERAGVRASLSTTNPNSQLSGNGRADCPQPAALPPDREPSPARSTSAPSTNQNFQLSTLNSQLTYWRPRIYSTTNPGGIGHAWYKKLFIQPNLRSHPNPNPNPNPNPDSGRAGCPQPAVPVLNSQPSTLNHQLLQSTINHQPSTIFIPARVDDNQFNNPEYRRILENLSGWQRRAWLDGDWDLAAGQFFTTFRRDIHVVTDPPSTLNSQLSTLNFWDATRAREWFAALDYGFAHYTVVLLGCTDGDGNVFVVDEHAERMWLPQRHAAAIKAMLRRHNVSLSAAQPSTINNPPSTISDSQLSTLNSQLTLARFVAGSDVFSRQSDGTTIAQQYAREGISLRPANMDRINGWAEILHLLGDPQSLHENSMPLNPQLSTLNSLRPRLFIHHRCGRLIETLPILQHDPNRPEDILKVDADEDGNGGDDAADALRYLVATKARTIVQRKLRGL